MGNVIYAQDRFRTSRYFRPGDRVVALDSGQPGIIQIIADDHNIIVQHFDGLRLRYHPRQLDHDGGAA